MSTYTFSESYNGTSAENFLENLIELLKQSNEKFLTLIHEYNYDIDALSIDNNTDDLLPMKKIKQYITAIQGDKKQARRFAIWLERNMEDLLYYGAIVEDIAYLIDPKVSHWMTDFFEDGCTYEFSEAFDGSN